MRRLASVECHIHGVQKSALLAGSGRCLVEGIVWRSRALGNRSR